MEDFRTLHLHTGYPILITPEPIIRKRKSLISRKRMLQYSYRTICSIFFPLHPSFLFLMVWPCITNRKQIRWTISHLRLSDAALRFRWNLSSWGASAGDPSIPPVILWSNKRRGWGESASKYDPMLFLWSGLQIRWGMSRGKLRQIEEVGGW